MGDGVGTILGGAMIAAAILVTHHFQISVTEHGGVGQALRLNRWTGTMEICVLDPATFNGKDLQGSELKCGPK
jgi:hypothetical protein